MNKKISALFNELKELPFPTMGKVVGDFGLYDSLLAGTASSYLAGVHLKGVPGPDEQSEQTLVLLKNKKKPSSQEREFLNYAQLLERLRSELIKATHGGPSEASGPQTQAVG